MTDTQLFFRSYKEIDTRAAFDTEVGISPQNIESLIGEYHFPVEEEEVPCQVDHEGKRCKEPHRNGWLGRRQDGKEALIGSSCGVKYFGANEKFVADRKRITRELSIKGYLERLALTKGNPDFENDLRRAIGRLKRIKSEVDDLRNALPVNIVRRLRGMAKAGSAGVEVNFRYDDDEDEEGNPKVSFVRQQIGQIDGLDVWNEVHFQNLFAQLYAIRTTLASAEVTRDAGPIKLKRWADHLDEFRLAQNAVDGLDNAIDAFMAIPNLHLVCFVVPSQNDATDVARYALKRAGDAAATEGNARQLYRQLRAQISELAGGRDFSIP